MSARPRSTRATSRRKRPERQSRPGLGGWLAPIIGSTIIVTLAWAASQQQATAEVFVGASLLFALLEGVVLAFVAAVWSARSLVWAVGMSIATALLAIPGRWELAYLGTGQRPPWTDLGVDLGVTLAWAALAGIAGATVLRERLLTLLPNR
jgi:hypothetical protein